MSIIKFSAYHKETGQIFDNLRFQDIFQTDSGTFDVIILDPTNPKADESGYVTYYDCEITKIEVIDDMFEGEKMSIMKALFEKKILNY